jgi:hypothetical protein
LRLVEGRFCGAFGENRLKTVFFFGEFVVNCVGNVVILRGAFLGVKNAPDF